MVKAIIEHLKQQSGLTPIYGGKVAFLEDFQRKLAHICVSVGGKPPTASQSWRVNCASIYQFFIIIINNAGEEYRQRIEVTSFL
ncbi:hypothetical protein AVEN_113503-1 [Araneus ventricosus]|uniref:Uncharacterized protein n=1 Tax=Araneus ventricosus TaxID=182803 RepID=A0A4Y2IBE6_ARAVE|nr:hypothetical protein AVEN_113503-1 [Araneus ventricosus]